MNEWMNEYIGVFFSNVLFDKRILLPKRPTPLHFKWKASKGGFWVSVLFLDGHAYVHPFIGLEHFKYVPW